MPRTHYNQVGFRGSLADRFWRKVTRASDDECWLWIGSTDPKGYGQIRMPGSKATGGGRLRFATHVSLELAGRGSVPDGMVAMHTCDNPPCVNPAHLLIGTRRENTQDSWRKGRASQPPTTGQFKKGVGLKEYCHRGHPLSGDNLYVWPSGRGRHCKKCARMNKAAMKARFLAKGLRSDGVPRKYPAFQPKSSDPTGA